MEFCPFHKKDCEDIEMITIIELKKGKIKQIKVCQNCVSKYLGVVSLVDHVPEDMNDIIEMFLCNKELIDECPNCLEINSENNPLTNEQKVKILENKMAAAVRVEDYEAAAMIKKQIEIIKSLN